METNDDLLTIRVKERFDRDFLPKYGALWRQMVKAKKPRQVRQPTVNDFAEAIHKKTSVCMTFPTSQNQKCSCGCAPPIVEAECHVSNARNSDGRNTNDGAGPNSLVIDLIESSDSENEFELHIANTKGFYDNDNAIDLMSLSDDESCDFDSPKKAANFRSSRLRTKRAVSYEVSSESSDENSSESVFDEEEDAMNDLIKTTQSIRIQEDKENNQSSRKEIRSQPTIKRSKIPMSKKQFKKRRQALTHDLFSEFNKKAFGGKLESVQLLWSTKLRTTAGLTRLKKSVQNMRPGIPQSRHATIELSTKVLDCQERLEATLLHEMVHAAAWIIDSVSNPPHGAAFWKWAKVAMRKVPGIVVTTTHSYEIEYKYAWACSKPGCGFIVKRQSKSVDLKKHCCGRCKGRLIPVNAMTAESDPVPKTKAAPSGYNLFVKEQSKIVREKLVKSEKSKGRKNPKVSQKEVMIECARLWRERKLTQAT